ncbi:MAG: S41 family peptidase [Pseudomonadota bacterium]
MLTSHKTRCIIPALVGVLAIVSGCETVSGENFSAQQPVQNNPLLSGAIWRSDGYGLVIDSSTTPLRAYEVTSRSCLEIELDGAELADFYDRVSFSDDLTVVRFQDTFDDHTFQYRKLASLPQLCQTGSAEADPLSVFDQFTAYFEEHYVFFDLYDVDWARRTEDFRPQINSETTESELFDLFVQMVDGIKDAHVEIVGEVDGERRKYDGDEGDLPRYINVNADLKGLDEEAATGAFYSGYLDTNISDRILSREGAMSANKYLRYGMIDESVGYLAAFHVGPYATGDDATAVDQRAAIGSEMDKAIALFNESSATAVIIDLSINFGGYDFVAREIARRFAPSPVTAYSKQALDTQNRIEPTMYELTPADQAFVGPVFLLTSNATVSGGEILTMSLRALPNVTHYGEVTRGALSDKLEKPLSNGWTITLSNEEYLDADQKLWEGKGIPPDNPLVVFESEDPLASHLQAVETLANVAIRNR